ncbi:MAG: hypothetical protein IKQ31_03090 [Clostridia bacterium]|nr:hypothetical protein [Clostridia bacterium]MBR4314009.1 hypothetical protein [Lachnospiraceae bacterium]
MAEKNGFVSAMDDLPFWAKIILCLPVLNLVYAVYRLVKGGQKGDVLMIVVGILWILFSAICWLIDLICTIIFKKPTVCA